MQWECSPSLPSTTSSGTFTLRMLGLVAMAPSLAMLLVAAALHPRSSGYGTHEQLGLPACGFLAQTGWPCITCGMTTSVSDMAHGRIADAFSAQPFGVALFVGAAVLSVAGGVQLVTAQNMLARLRVGMSWLLVALLGLTAGWVWKMCAGAMSGLYPLH